MLSLRLHRIDSGSKGPVKTILRLCIFYLPIAVILYPGCVHRFSLPSSSDAGRPHQSQARAFSGWQNRRLIMIHTDRGFEMVVTVMRDMWIENKDRE